MDMPFIDIVLIILTGVSKSIIPTANFIACPLTVTYVM